MAFKVQGGGDVAAYEYRRVNAGTVSTLIATYPSITSITSKLDATYSDRVDYVWGVLDAAKRLGLGLRRSGELDIGAFLDVTTHIEDLETLAPVELSERSGYLWGVKDAQGRLALGIDKNGDLISKGINVLTGISTVAELAASSKWVSPSTDIAAFGDSMSENTWQPYLRLLRPDIDIIAGGVGGQKAGQIARRLGSIAPMISISGNTIPPSGGVACTVDVAFMWSGQVVYGYLYGVFGTLSYVSSVLTFTRSTAGSAVVIDPVTPFLMSETDYDYLFRTVIIWAGNNDYASGDRPYIDGIVTRMVESLKPSEKRFAVIGMAIADYADRYIGTPYYTDTMALHATWRDRWPNNFIDITPIMQRNYDPGNPQDVIDLANGCTPSSLRADNVHFNAAGWQIVADTVHNFLTQRGW